MRISKLKHFLMRILVWNMRWMTRYLGSVARPIVQAYGAHEVIACGLRGADGVVYVIYTPLPDHKDHKTYVRKNRKWVGSLCVPTSNFSGSAVVRVEIPGARRGDIYRMQAARRNGGKISSPTIIVKERTVYSPRLMDVSQIDSREVVFSWKSAEVHDPMIYFLAIEDEKKRTCAAVYTRERFWVYPKVKTASYSLGPDNPPVLISGQSYIAKLTLVDYDGWVSHMAESRFSVL